MNNWTEIRTAYQVGRLGTVSAAAEYLGVHRATVIRHVDALEAALGGKLFHRHKKGYAPTDLGNELIRMAEASERQFMQLVGKAKGDDGGLEGEFIVTSMDHAVHLFLPALGQFQASQPGLKIRYIETDTRLRLEYGEAHIAFRMGSKPDHPDYVVRHFGDIPLGLYAHENYVRDYGKLGTQDENRAHRFIAMDGTLLPAPLQAWHRRNVPKDAYVLATNSQYMLHHAVLSGLAVGFIPMHIAERYPELVVMADPNSRWKLTVWMVTHVDAHRSAKVQAFLGVINNLREGVDHTV
ncbi:MAG: LysR family transcriptional regulator [Pseudomonadota bacterium]